MKNLDFPANIVKSLQVLSMESKYDLKKKKLYEKKNLLVYRIDFFPPQESLGKDRSSWKQLHGVCVK